MIGDFNARTGLSPDITICQNITQWRYDKDKYLQVNLYGTLLLQLCENSEKIICKADFLWQKHCWLFSIVKTMLRDFKIRQLLAYPDHCPFL